MLNPFGDKPDTIVKHEHNGWVVTLTHDDLLALREVEVLELVRELETELPPAPK